MNDDDTSNIVRNGTQHSVSVSEHTGNAQTPKNIIISHEEETEARKLAFEKNVLATLASEKTLAAALTKHTEDIASEEVATATNIQKMNTGVKAKNLQKKITDNALSPNVQDVPTDVIDANLQKVSSDKNITVNHQDIPTDVITSNQQNVGSNNIAANKQSIAGEKSVDANLQGIPPDTLAVNVQDMGEELMGLNSQGLDNISAMTPNSQTLVQDDVESNRQFLKQDEHTKNEQGILTEAMSSNAPKLAKLGVQNNQQPIEQAVLTPHSQVLPPATSTTPDNQAMGTDERSLNRQVAPEDALNGTNSQGVGNSKIGSHFEPLLSGEIEQKKVNFSAFTPTHSTTPSTSNHINLVTEKIKQAATTPRAPMTVAEQQQANLKREQMNEAFHGRLAGIKHNVDALNSRLSDFEEQVHKENSKLEKGNPDDFEINLD